MRATEVKLSGIGNGGMCEAVKHGRVKRRARSSVSGSSTVHHRGVNQGPCLVTFPILLDSRVLVEEICRR